MMTMLLLAVMGSVWAVEVTTTYIFTSREWTATCNGEDANWNRGLRANGYTAGQGIQITAASTGAYATSPVPFWKVKKIVVTYCTNSRAGNGTIKLTVGPGAEQTFSVTAPSSGGGTSLKTTEFTYDPNETGSVTLTVDCTTNSIYIYSIAITSETTESSTYSVYYDCNGGESGCPDDLSDVPAGNTITLPTAPTRDGYTFDGWNNETDTYDAGDTYTVNSDVTFTAQWTENSTSKEEWVLTDLEDLTSDDIFVIVGNNGTNYAMVNETTSYPPVAYEVIVSNVDNKIKNKVPDKLKWNISLEEEGYTFHPNGSSSTWLYAGNSNNGVRVGTGSAKHFSLSNEGYLTTTETTDRRYLGIYNSQDWRTYTSINSNIKEQTFAFYKRVVVEEVQLNTDGYITYVTKNAIDWVKTLARNSQDGVDVHGYKVVDFGLDNGVSIVEYGVENLPSVTSTDKMYQEPIIPAGTPIIIQGKQGANYMVVADDENVAAPAGNLLLASDGNATTTDDVKLFVLQKINQNGSGIENYAFYKLTKGRTIPEGKAYLSSDNVTLPDPDTPGFDPNKVRTSNPIRVLVQTNNDPLVSDDAGIIDGIGTVAQDSEDGQVIYNVNGVSVNNPSKGIYVKNGKKVIIK